MRLTKIKLAGFKSFVDPTTLQLPSNLVGIVGPNGCGKSNIIDAVRWVMGESSARTLRGESMADVIFNGSASRKPVGQATIELVFDNSQGRLGGPWAQYNEISIKRQVSRDGQSTYFLNGTRCRRRDITDIFLGTGLGPRSYAIIEQGMISRVIDARPEDLRVFLEEAAGISRYKERRRETELRIAHTRENLDRLNDVREELGRQLQHLQRQAQAAEQYRRYREEERRVKAELLALRWRTLNADLAEQEQALRAQETALEAVIAEQRRLEARLESGRDQQFGLNEALSQAQGRYYEVGAAITRQEQELTHQQQLRQRQTEELRQIEQQLAQFGHQQQLDTVRASELDQALQTAEPALAIARASEAEAETTLAAADAAMQDWQAEWERFSHSAGEVQRRAEVERARSEQLERQLLNQERRLERLRLEQDTLADAGLDGELAELRQAEQVAGEAVQQAQMALDRVMTELGEQRERQRQLQTGLHALRERSHAGRGRLASLHALQEAALGRRDSMVHDWLAGQGLAQAPRLAQCLQVEPGWERAVETVLGGYLEAVCVNDLTPAAATLASLSQGQLALFDTGTGTDPEPPTTGLAGKVQAPWSLHELLAGVEAVADLPEALARRPELAAQQSLVTADGTWLGRHWLRLKRGDSEQAGLLAREREIQTLTVELEQAAVTLTQHGAELDQVQAALHQLEQQRAALQDEVNQGHREHARLQGRLNALHARLEQVQARREAVADEQAELVYQVEQEQEQLQESRLRLEDALASMAEFNEQRQTLTEQRDRRRATLEECRATANTRRREAQQQTLATAALHSERTAIQQALARLGAQRQQLQARHEHLTIGLAQGDEPLDLLREQLEELLGQRLTAETALTAARQAVTAQEAALRELEQARSRCEQQADALRQTLAQQQVQVGELGVRRQLLLDQLQELAAEPVAVLAELPPEAAEAPWQQRLDTLAHRIQRLGAINLAAIEECAQLSERKQYLDAQNADLNEALATLEEAMRKIDRETRSRFKDTFERVNAGLQALFPRLFGGGQAHLELTEDDLLEAGVSILARPPGKRIGHIQLLSGGEKALTAVALVFAIFQLNPAPFCLLDEVDAPLDEANVGRFGQLVREMSEQVQFLFITHNKATMEIARHLAGVTMQEPGVSRLVAVDVDEAVRLAAL